MAVSRAAKDAPLPLSLTARLERPSLNQLIVVVVVPTQTANVFINLLLSRNNCAIKCERERGREGGLLAVKAL